MVRETNCAHFQGHTKVALTTDILVIVDTTGAHPVKYSCTQNSTCPDRGMPVYKRSSFGIKQLMLKRGENKSVLNMKIALHRFGVVGNVSSRGFDHGGHGGVPSKQN